MRHRADAAVNNTPTVIVRNGKVETVRARDVEIGDIIKVNNEETIPCDMVLLSSVNPNGSCYVTTGKFLFCFVVLASPVSRRQGRIIVKKMTG